jgi:hypothetical protein
MAGMENQELLEQWEAAGEPFDPTEATSKEEAVFIGRQMMGDTVIIGREDAGEWLTTQDMGPLELAKYR